MKSVELLRLNLAIEPDLQNFVGFLMQTVRHLKGSAFQTALASLKLNQQVRAAGACRGQVFPISLNLKDQTLLACWEKSELELVQVSNTDPLVVDGLRESLRKSTESTDPEILLQRNEAMMRHLNETRELAERELASLQSQLLTRQEELQVSIMRAETDPLTMLANRRAFDEKLNRDFRYTMRQKNSPLSLVLLDLDYFKQVNDEFGHQFGDAYLNKMAHILRSVIREDVDSAFRFGGDEFAMLIHADFITACEKSRQVIQQMDGKVSIGIATIDKNTPASFTVENFINNADSALYEAKHLGRGRAVVCQCDSSDTRQCDTSCVEKELSA